MSLWLQKDHLTSRTYMFPEPVEAFVKYIISPMSNRAHISCSFLTSRSWLHTVELIAIPNIWIKAPQSIMIWGISKTCWSEASERHEEIPQFVAQFLLQVYPRLALWLLLWQEDVSGSSASWRLLIQQWHCSFLLRSSSLHQSLKRG